MVISPAKVLGISVAGIRVNLDLEATDAFQQVRLQEPYSHFLVPAQPGAPSIHLRFEPGPDFIPHRGTIFEIRTYSDNGRVDFESYREKGWFDLQTHEGELILRPSAEPENFLRVFYACCCIQANALLLHACGVIRDGRGYVFFGPSGSGKTTIARLSLHHTVLSDDLVIIKREGEQFRVYGVPFQGDFPEAPRTNAAAELAGVFALAKDTEHYLVDLNKAEAVARLAACVPFVMSRKDDAKRVMGLCGALVGSVPVRTLHFKRDAGVWEAVDGR